MNAPDKLKIGDVLECEVRVPVLHFLRMRLLTDDSVAYGEELLRKFNTPWRKVIQSTPAETKPAL